MTRVKRKRTLAAAVGVVACICMGLAFTASHADQPADPVAAELAIVPAEISSGMDHGFVPNANAAAPVDAQAGKQPIGDPRDGGRVDCGVLTFTQSAAQNFVAGSVACSPDNGTTTSDNAYARCFTISNGGVDVDLKCIQFGIEAINLADHTADIVLSILPAGCPPTTPTPVGGPNEIYRQTMTFLVTDRWPALVEVELIPSILIPDGSTVVVELQSPDQGTISGMWIGSNPTEPSGDTFLHSVACGLSTYTEVGVIGFPGMNWVVNLKGNPFGAGAGACCLGNGICLPNLDPATCAANGGFWQGTGTPCVFGVTCEGACCFLDGSCTDGDLDACNLVGGAFNGFGTACTPTNPCPQPCPTVCPPGAINEVEPCGNDDNGGCNMDPGFEAFEPIACGDTVCGTYYFDDVTGIRDTDWYEVVTTQDRIFTFTLIEGTLNTVIGLVETDPAGSGDCATGTGFITPFAVSTVTPCLSASITTDCLPAGIYWFFVAPDFPDPAVNQPCTDNHRYVVSLSCQSCQLPRCPVGSLFAQEPELDDWLIATSDIAAGIRMFEDYSIVGLICDVHWWGSNAFFDGTAWTACTKAPPELFNIEFWADDGTGIPDIAAGPVCQYLNVAPTKTDTTFDLGQYDLYQYDMDLTALGCCSLVNGWVSIQGIDSGESCWSMWSKSNITQAPNGYSYQEGATDPINDFDVAVCLTGQLLEVDVFDSNIEIDVVITDLSFVGTLMLSNYTRADAQVFREPGPYTSGVDIGTQMAVLEATGADGTLGTIEVRERADRESTGVVSNVVASGGNFVSGDSSFDMWVEIELTDTTLPPLYTLVPHPMAATAPITSFPPSQGTIYVWPNRLKGDMDGDGDVDGDDIWQWVICFVNGDYGQINPNCQFADMNKDLAMDFIDTAFFSQTLLGAGGTSPIALYVDDPTQRIVGQITGVRHIIKVDWNNACCIPGTGCVHTIPTQQDCEGPLGGIWNQNTSCPDTDPICGGGSCCLPNGVCVRVADESECINIGGNFTPDQPCSPNPCFGSCCLALFGGIEACVENVTQSECASFSSIMPCPIGNECLPPRTCVSGFCEPVYGVTEWHALADCTACQGACCFLSGACDFLFEEDCNIQGGFFQGNGTTCTPNPCPLGPCTQLTCATGTPEFEACGADSNGGCAGDPPTLAFEVIACGGTVCGTTWADLSTRDTDWYEFTLTAPLSDVTWCAVSELPIALFIIVPGSPDPCLDLTIETITGYADCDDPGACATAQLAAGTYWAWVGPGNPDGSGIFDGFPCGVIRGNDYEATLTCTPVEP